MNVEYDGLPQAPENIVYVRSVNAADLPEEVRAELVDAAETLYAVHNSDGERLALVEDRKLAFIIARQNDLSPVSVH